MRAVEHRFTGPSFTLGIEEELMIVDAETLELSNSIETLLEGLPETTGEVKPELMESVCEISTTPCETVREAGDQLRSLRALVQQTAAEHGLAIGSAYAVGSLALGASLVVGFALHNTTEGLAIVAPASGGALRPRRLVLLGLVAGAPAILGAVIGATAFNAALAAFLFGLGAGAIAQVVVQLAPSLRDDDGRLLGPLTAGGVLAGLALMYATGLLISLR